MHAGAHARSTSKVVSAYSKLAVDMTSLYPHRTHAAARRCAQLLDQMDNDGDGEVNLNEYITWLHSDHD